MADAVELIAARAAKGPAKKKPAKAAAKKTAKAKSPVKAKSPARKVPRRAIKKPSRRRQAEFCARVAKRKWAQGPRRTQQAKAGKLPSKQDILDFLRGSTGEAGKREIARAFGVKGGDRSRAERAVARDGR